MKLPRVQWCMGLGPVNMRGSLLSKVSLLASANCLLAETHLLSFDIAFTAIYMDQGCGVVAYMH